MPSYSTSHQVLKKKIKHKLIKQIYLVLNDLSGLALRSEKKQKPMIEWLDEESVFCNFPQPHVFRNRFPALPKPL